MMTPPTAPPPNFPPQDAALLARHAAGDPSATEEIYRRVDSVIQAVVAKRLRRERVNDWGDVCQAARLRFFRSLPNWRMECSLETWAGVIAGNIAIDFLRRIDDEILVAPDDFRLVDKPTADPLRGVVDCLEWKQARFPPPWQEALRLHQEGLTQVRIGQQLHVSRRLVQIWFSEMYRELHGCLED
jgi:RNA polymerase sigma factor (sigma-70 family)